MTKKDIIFFGIVGVVFYFLNIFQMSFLPFFDCFLLRLNFMVFLALAICLLEEPKKKLGYSAAFWAGFYLDLLAGARWFGIFTVSFLIVAVIIKIVLDKYVKIPPWQWLTKIQS